MSNAWPNVTMVTRNADADDLTDDDYHDIYIELRGQHTLREFAALSQTRYSIAWWSKIEHGAELTRDARNDLRRAVGLAPLPPTVAQATASADPGAVVYQVGAAPATRVILVGHPAPLTMHLNGELDVSEEIGELAPKSRVTEVTRARNRRAISVPCELWQRLNEARIAAGASWATFLNDLLSEENHHENAC